MNIADIRRQRLRDLIRERYSNTARQLAVDAKKPESQINDMLANPPRKSFGERVARDLEQRLGLSNGFFDKPTGQFAEVEPNLSAQESPSTYRTEPASRAERVADKVAELPDDDPLLDYLEDMLAGRWARQGGGGGWVKKALADRDRREDKLKLKKSRGAA